MATLLSLARVPPHLHSDRCSALIAPRSSHLNSTGVFIQQHTNRRIESSRPLLPSSFLSTPTYNCNSLLDHQSTVRTPWTRPLRCLPRASLQKPDRGPGAYSAPSLKDNISAKSTAVRIPPPSMLQILWRRTIRELSSLPLAISLLFAIAGACALGTVIEQGASPATYIHDYPLENPVLGFLTWQIILGLGLDHVYTNPAFLALLFVFAGCLASCTSTRQFPMLKVARRWSFIKKASSVLNLQFSESLPWAKLDDVGVELKRHGYQVFREGDSLYGFKGLAGRLAPIGVHAAMLLVMVGGTYSSLGGFRGTVMVPQGLQVFVPDALRGESFLARPTSSMNMIMQLDNFYIEYRPNGEVKQFYSDLTLQDFTGRELLRKTISVNDPLRCQGVTVYQTDWSISSVQLRVDGGDPMKLPVATLKDPNGSDAKLFGTFLPLQGEPEVEGGRPKGITILARDLQSVVLYDAEGAFVGVRRPGSRKPIEISGVKVQIEDIIGSSGLELKMDPGVPLVYSGFGALMLTSFISYLSHSQVWALQEGSTVHLGGKTNRAKYTFQDELNKIADSIPEVLPAEAKAQ